MRPPLPFDALENSTSESDVVSRDSSYPDRGRIDSDVRAFLRPVSTPWIVFDRASRIDKFARFGRPSSSRLTFEGAASSSNVAIAADAAKTPLPITLDALPPYSESAPMAARTVKGRRLAAIAAIGAGLLALVGGTTIVLSGGARAEAKPAAARAPATPSSAPPALDDVLAPLPPRLDLLPASAPVSKAAANPKKRFGRLTVKAVATNKSVWLDGKRLLGNGHRSFVVFCGMHTIAVGDKADARDIEVPCNGEYSISR